MNGKATTWYKNTYDSWEILLSIDYTSYSLWKIFLQFCLVDEKILLHSDLAVGFDVGLSFFYLIVRERERLYGEAGPRFSGDKQRIKSCAMMELCRKWSAGPASAATLLLRLINPLCTSYVCYVLKLYIYTMLECY